MSQSEIKALVALGVAEVLEQLGISAGEVSERQAVVKWGKWFKQAVADQRIRPSRIGEGRNGTRHYSVTDILALKAQDTQKAQLLK